MSKRKWFTLYRWRTHQWQMYALMAIIWGSGWQIHDAVDMTHTGLSWANLAGGLVMLIGLHLCDKEDSRSMERWGSVMLLWSMSAYLALALRFDGWMGLFHQANFGVLLGEAVVVATLHRFIYTIMATRVDKRKAKEVHEASLILDDLGLLEDPPPCETEDQ